MNLKDIDETLEEAVLARRILLDLMVYSSFYKESMEMAIASLEAEEDSTNDKDLFTAIRVYMKKKEELYKL